MHLLILSNCSDKKKDDSNTIINISNADTYILKNENETYNISLVDKNILINSIPHPIIILNLFNPTSSTCLAHTKTIKKLENKNILVVNITKSTQDKENINFVNEIHKILGINNHSLNILSILYIKGRYYQHYEGLTPIEMIQHDIQANDIN